MAVSASTLPKRKPAVRRKSRRKQSSGWLAWWPLALGIAVTPFAVKAATLMALAGPEGLRLLYPWMLVAKLHLFALSDAAGNGISQAMMYLQFPLYGIAAMLIYRAKGAAAALLGVALLHLGAVALLFVAAHA